MDNIEKFESLRLLREDNFLRIANRDMGNFIHFWGGGGYYGLNLHILIDIELYIAENM